MHPDFQLDVTKNQTLRQRTLKHIQTAIDKGLTGMSVTCQYYPCHHEGQDCTWCFCPFYPCLNFELGGNYTESRKNGRLIWNCSECTWVHDPAIAERILKLLKKVTDIHLKDWIFFSELHFNLFYGHPPSTGELKIEKKIESDSLMRIYNLGKRVIETGQFVKIYHKIQFKTPPLILLNNWNISGEYLTSNRRPKSSWYRLNSNIYQYCRGRALVIFTPFKVVGADDSFATSLDPISYIMKKSG